MVYFNHGGARKALKIKKADRGQEKLRIFYTLLFYLSDNGKSKT